MYVLPAQLAACTKLQSAMVPRELLNPGFCNFGNAALILPCQKNPALPARVSFPAANVISPNLARSVSVL